MICKYCGRSSDAEPCEECLQKFNDTYAHNRPPCGKECHAREVGCHGRCDWYQRFCIQAEKVRHENMLKGKQRELRRDAVEKMLRKKRKGGYVYHGKGEI